DGVEFKRVWDRGKELVPVADDREGAARVADLARRADVLLLSGSEESLERHGVSVVDLSHENRRLVVVRIRPSVNGLGGVDDVELLVQARAGVLSQFRAHRPPPAFCDLPIASAGAALAATVGALACLYEREATGLGGWAETSLYDGIVALLPLIIGRVEHPSPSTVSLWEDLGPSI